MNMPLTTTLEDVQNTPDKRLRSIDKVGIKSLKYPVFFQNHDEVATRVVADFSMYVSLPHHVKGTHMSRFIELLERPNTIFSVHAMPQFMDDVLSLLGAEQAYVSLEFPFFMHKTAPVSGAKSMMDYTVTLMAERAENYDLTVKLAIPVTSLCPCSKKISNYGAHNQRSMVTVTVKLNHSIEIEDLIKLIEAQASSQLYGLLKRQDEKFVTEYAYDNPKFVEDLIRDIAGALDSHTAVKGFKVECENFESIHNHSAYAFIDAM